jgi:hypothetical protein
MKSIFYSFIFGILSLFVQQSIDAQISATSFTVPSSLPLPTTVSPIKLISFRGSLDNNKILLQWVIGENETADQFEIERSADGKNFVMAALVFGTDKPETADYLFYEKAGTEKISYRIKIIDKKGKAVYSDILVIDPASQNNHVAFVKN